MSISAGHIAFIILLVYAGLCILFYVLQDFFFFRPEKLPVNFTYKYPFPFEEINFTMADGGSVNAILFRVPNSKGVIYYLKGNSRSIKGWGKFAKDFVSKGYDFFMIDYRGFGKSRGRRTESTMYSDTEFVYQWLLERYDEQNIVVYGRSLGSGFATRVASNHHPKMLILDSPYYSFYHQIMLYGFWMPIKLLLRYQVRTDLFIKKVTCPIFIFHGDRDRFIPYKFGVMLSKLVPDKAKLITIRHARHNNMPGFPQYHEKLYEILHADEVVRAA